MNNNTKQERTDVLNDAINSLRKTPGAESPPASVLESTIESLNQLPPLPDQVRLNHRRALMFRIARYSGLSAAVIALAVIGTLVIGTQPLAFADVVENVKKAKSVTLTSRQIIGSQPALVFAWYLQGDNLRMEIPDQVIVIGNLEQKKGLQINVASKTAYEYEVEEGVLGAFANPVDQIRQVKPDDAKAVGEEQLNDRKTLVYEFDRIDFLGMEGKGQMKVWVDPETKLPVKIRVGANTRSGSKSGDRPFDTVMILEDFEWNKKLNPELFKLEAPEGYQVKQGRFGPGQ